MKKETKKQLLIGAALVLELLFLLLYLNGRIDRLLDSDMSSEMILGQLLARENAVLTPHWHYSTELRVLNTQIIYAFFFKLMNNWHLVRMAATVCFWGIMLAAFYFLCRQFRCTEYFLLLSILLLSPFSQDYFNFVLMGGYYIPHIAIEFAALGLNEMYHQSNGRKKWLSLAGSVILAVLAGMGGPRMILELYFPLGLAALVELLNRTNRQRGQQFFYAVVTSAFGALGGYAVNVFYLHQRYQFQKWDDLRIDTSQIERLKDIIGFSFAAFGLENVGTSLPLQLVSSVVSIGWVSLTVLCIAGGFTSKASARYRRLASCTLAAYAAYIVLYCVTNMELIVRYSLPTNVLTIPLIAVAFQELRGDAERKQKFLGGWVVLVAAWSLFVLLRVGSVDKNAGLRAVSEELVNDGYANGYATFWNANVLTELSDAELEVWCWCDHRGGWQKHGVDVDKMYPWLQLTSHDTERPAGKVFVLFSQEEFEDNPWKQNLQPEDVIYESEEYVVLGYPDYETMKATLEKDL